MPTLTAIEFLAVPPGVLDGLHQTMTVTGTLGGGQTFYGMPVFSSPYSQPGNVAIIRGNNNTNGWLDLSRTPGAADWTVTVSPPQPVDWDDDATRVAWDRLMETHGPTATKSEPVVDLPVRAMRVRD